MASFVPGEVSTVEAYDLITMTSVPCAVIVMLEILRSPLPGRKPIGSSVIS